MAKSGIYKITLNTDGRIYIGSSCDIDKRWRWHRGNTTQLIGKMIKKHGISSFSFEVIEEVSPEKILLEKREQFYLDSLQPFPWVNNQGFNLAPTAYTPLGIKRSEETKQKMRDSWHKNRGDQYFKQLSERIRGEKNPAKRPDVRKKIAKSMQGKTWKDDHARVERHKLSHVGKTRSSEAKENMKKAQQQNNTRSDAAKEIFYLAQRILYEVTSPSGDTFKMYSRELKAYCKNNNLQYASLITTARTNKYYKKWRAKKIDP